MAHDLEYMLLLACPKEITPSNPLPAPRQNPSSFLLIYFFLFPRLSVSHPRTAHNANSTHGYLMCEICVEHPSPSHTESSCVNLTRNDKGGHL